VLINDSRRAAATVAVRPPVPADSATGLRLRAPRVGARSGVTLGGQSFGAATSTGMPTGPVRTFELRARHGVLVVRLPPASATLVTAPTP
jgi:hypothetical protein